MGRAGTPCVRGVLAVTLACGAAVRLVQPGGMDTEAGPRSPRQPRQGLAG